MVAKRQSKKDKDVVTTILMAALVLIGVAAVVFLALEIIFDIHLFHSH